MSTVTVIGSLNYDLVTYTSKVPQAGETLAAHLFENHLGGKGLNEALATARLSKGPVRMIGNVGDDGFGKELKQALVDAGVDTSFVATLSGELSGVAVILVEDCGENRILITAGANGRLQPSDSDYERYFPEDAGFVVLQNEYPDTVKTILWLKQHRPHINVAYNPSPFKPEWISSDVLGKIDFLIVNEGEALELAAHVLPKNDEFQKTIATDKVQGFSLLAKTLQQQLNQANVSTVVVTMGSVGSVFTSSSGAPEFHKSLKVEKVVDTTGAGDTFFGGVVLQLASGESLSTAVAFATVASSLVIQKKGAAESIPKMEEVQKNIK